MHSSKLAQTEINTQRKANWYRELHLVHAPQAMHVGWRLVTLLVPYSSSDVPATVSYSQNYTGQHNWFVMANDTYVDITDNLSTTCIFGWEVLWPICTKPILSYILKRHFLTFENSSVPLIEISAPLSHVLPSKFYLRKRHDEVSPSVPCPAAQNVRDRGHG